MNFCTRFLRLLMSPWLREKETADCHLLARMTGKIQIAASGYDESWQHSRTLTGHDQCFPGQPVLSLSYRFPVALLWNTSSTPNIYHFLGWSPGAFPSGKLLSDLVADCLRFTRWGPVLKPKLTDSTKKPQTVQLGQLESDVRKSVFPSIFHCTIFQKPYC